MRELGRDVVAGMKRVFQTSGMVVIYPSSGTGAWEAALVNTLSPGDMVLMWETGHFASLWKKMADKLGIKSEFMGGDWRLPADPAAIQKRLLDLLGEEALAADLHQPAILHPVAGGGDDDQRGGGLDLGRNVRVGAERSRDQPLHVAGLGQAELGTAGADPHLRFRGGRLRRHGRRSTSDTET